MFKSACRNVITTLFLLFLACVGFAQQKAEIPFDTLWNHYQKCDKSQILSANKRLDVLEKRAVTNNDTLSIFKVAYERSIINVSRFGKWDTRQLLLYYDSIRKSPFFVNTAYEGIVDYLIFITLYNSTAYYNKYSSIEERDLIFANIDINTLKKQYLEDALSILAKFDVPTPQQCNFLFKESPIDTPFPAHQQLYDVILFDFLDNYKSSNEEAIVWIKKALLDRQGPAYRDNIIDYEIRLASLALGGITLPLDSNPYWQKLLKLEGEYGASDVFTYTKGRAIYDAAPHSTENETSPLPQQALPYFNQLLETSTCPYYRHNAAYYKEDIERTILRFNSRNKEYMPAAKISIPIAFKNIDTLYVSIYETKGNHDIKWIRRIDGFHYLIDDFSTLRSTKHIGCKTFILDKPEKNTLYTTDLWLDSLATGHYILLFHGQPDWDTLNVLAAQNIQVTDVQIAAYGLTDGKNVLLAMNRRTGEPLKYKNAKIGYLTYRMTDKNGRIPFNSFYYNKDITFRNGPHDVLGGSYRKESCLYALGNNNPSNSSNYKSIITDRTLYRPGQTIYFKFISIRNNKPEKDLDVTIGLMDNSYQVIDSLTVRTNEFGSATGTFRLPDDKTGWYSLLCHRVRKNINVEVYKLPTFAVALEEDTAATCQGDSLHIRGKALSLAGTPIADADVTINILYGNNKNLTFKTECNQEGTFDFPFLTPVLENFTESYPLNINVQVTDVNGETQLAQKSYTIPRRPFSINFESAESIDQATTSEVSWAISVRNIVQKSLDIPISLSVTRLQQPAQYLPYYYQGIQQPSYRHYPLEEYEKNFPGFTFESSILVPSQWPTKETFYQTTKSFKNDSVLTIDIHSWPMGTYRVTLTTTDARGRTDTMTKHIDIFRSDIAHPNRFSPIWVALPKSTAIGDSLPVVVGTHLHNVTLICDVYQGKKRLKTNTVNLDQEQRTLLVPTRKRGHYQIYVMAHISQNNHVYSASNQTELLHESIPPIKPDLINIQLTHWNSTLEPGGNAQWEISLQDVNTPEDKEIELLTWMIDGSLYKLGMDGIKFPMTPTFIQPKRKANQTTIVGNLTSTTIRNRTYPYTQDYIFKTNLISQASPTLREPINTFMANFTSSTRRRGSSDILRTTPGRSVTSSLSNLDGVSSIDGDMTTVRGNRSEGQQVVVDGIRVRYEPPVFTLSTTEEKPIQEPLRESAEKLSINKFQFSPNIRMRHNFTETAFFYPQLRADSNGHIHFRFTVPDQYTEWKFYALAHNKTNHCGWLEQSLLSRRTMMIQSNAPRFLREGDTLTLQIKISSLSDTLLEGKATIRFYNFATGEPISILLNASDSLQDFRCEAKGTTSVQWRCAVPQGIEALSYKVLAQANTYGDGEERSIPVLSNRALLTESMHFTVPAKRDTTLFFQRFANTTSNTLQHYSYTMEMTSNPTWFAIQSLPYLIQSKYENNEQIFARLYANAIALHIVNHHPDIAKIYEQWRNDTTHASLTSPLLKNEEMKGILIEETPWVWQAQRENDQRTAMANLFEQKRL